jgi:hypothetical protein
MKWWLIIFVAVPVILFFLYLVYNKQQRGHPGVPVIADNISLPIIEQRLREHVWALAEEIGERHHENLGSLDKSADYIESTFLQYGLDTHRQVYGSRDFRNIIADIKGKNRTEEIILVGAHYDTVWLSPGADDNASGVAVMLELAKLLAGHQFVKTIRFVGFTNEEQPFSNTELMGSRVYTRHAFEHRENIKVMYSLEMLGYYSDEKSSQQYPAPLQWLYPDRASFIAFVANTGSGLSLYRSLCAFRKYSLFPVQGLIMPEQLIPDIRRSDHASFWDMGYPAIMVTDTAMYRNRNYHTVGDLPGTLDYKKMAELVSGLAYMLADLAIIVQE